MYEKIKNITSLILSKIGDSHSPQTAIILGSGLGSLVEHIQNPITIPYASLAGFPQSTVAGHQGAFVYGSLQGRPVIVMSGRFHFYEGYSMEQVTLPIRVMACLGIKQLIVSNAAGGVDTSFRQGDLMLITDHINMMPNPLIGKNLDQFGPRFPSMHNGYDPALRNIMMKCAQKLGITLQQGVYLGLTGPSYETPAEYKFFRTIGAAAVGMSTVPEVIVARQMNIPTVAISLISNVVGQDAMVETNHTEVQEIGRAATEKMTLLIKLFLDELD